MKFQIKFLDERLMIKKTSEASEKFEGASLVFLISFSSDN